jgi:hypothetical protein
VAVRDAPGDPAVLGNAVTYQLHWLGRVLSPVMREFVRWDVRRDRLLKEAPITRIFTNEAWKSTIIRANSLQSPITDSSFFSTEAPTRGCVRSWIPQVPRHRGRVCPCSFCAG